MSDTLRIINELQNHPCIYDSTDEDHKNQNKMKKAYEDLTAKVNQRASKRYTVKAIMKQVENVIKKYRLIRHRRMKNYYMNDFLPQPPKWWIMMHYLLNGEKIKKVKFASIEPSKTFIKKYKNKESWNLVGLKFDSGSVRTEKDIKDMLVSAEIEENIERDTMIRCLHSEPVLCDPKHKYYKNQKYKDAAYKRIANKMNKDFLDGYTAASVKLFIKVLREFYREIRHERFSRYLDNRSMSIARRSWWGELNTFLEDEKEDFLKDDDGTVKDYLARENDVLINDEEDTEFEFSSDCDSEDVDEEEDEEEEEEEEEEEDDDDVDEEEEEDSE